MFRITPQVLVTHSHTNKKTFFASHTKVFRFVAIS